MEIVESEGERGEERNPEGEIEEGTPLARRKLFPSRERERGESPSLLSARTRARGREGEKGEELLSRRK